MIARILALFVGLFILVNFLGNLFWPGFDANLWWIHFGAWLPAWFASAILAISGATLTRFSVRHRRPGQRDTFTAILAAGLALAALINAGAFYWLMAKGTIQAGFPIPFSLVVFAALGWIARAAWREARRDERLHWGTIGAGAAGMCVMFPLALMLFFGNTDYRRPADAAVVFGARAYADGRMSDALRDRIRTACVLYREGMARRLVLSGGQGDGAVTEAQAMRNYALQNGVRAEDIFMDDLGVNTEATVRNTEPLFRQWHARRILAVSHFYHLPRIKLAYQRAGVEVWTVPARQQRLMGQIPFNMAREAAAFWDYYLKDRPVRSAPRA